MLKKHISKNIWRNIPYIIIHPGIVGNQGASLLDCTITTNKEKTWSVTVLQGNDEFDNGAI